MQKILLRIAAALVLLTCAGHTAGTFAPIPPEQVELTRAVEVMRQTTMPLPMGVSRDLIELRDGQSLCLSLFLFFCGALLILLSGSEFKGGLDRAVLFVTSVTLGALSALAWRYFFPVPAICTGLAAALGLVSFAKAGAARASRP